MALSPAWAAAQDAVSNSVAQDLQENQMILQTARGNNFYNTSALDRVDIDSKSGIVTVTTSAGKTDTYRASVRGISFAKAQTAQSVVISKAEGWQECAWAEWQAVKGATKYNVYIKGGQYADWTKVDPQLVRTYSDGHCRVDAVGLRAGTYSLRVAAVSNNAEGTPAEVRNLNVKSYPRTGFAHKGYSGVGAYNDDGTLKSGAVVVYVNAKNAKTVQAKLSSGTFTGLQGIITALEKGNVTTPVDIRIIGLITADDVDEFGSSAEGIQVKGRKADSELNLTIEGIGDDATIKGFGFLVRNSKSVEMRNFAVMRQMDDGISLDTDNSNIWLHNIDVFYGKSGGGDHAKGDGSIDVKADSKFVTIDHCHFWDCGKTSMCGMKSETGPNYITYHHNWFDHSDSRHARVRTMSVHMWNNYFDGNAKYGVGAVMGSSVFVENNYFRGTKDPMLISQQGTDAKGSGTFSGEEGGMIKAFGNVIAEKGASSNYTPIAYSTNKTDFDYYDAKTRDEKVPADVKSKSGAHAYDNFDTDSKLMYTYAPDAADDVPGLVTGYYGAGRLGHGNIVFAFNNATDDSDYGVNSKLAALIDGYNGDGLIINGSTTEKTDTTKTDTTKTDPQQPDKPVVTDGTLCTFSGSAPSSSVFTVNGNYAKNKGTAVIDGQTYNVCLKMESATSIKFTLADAMTLTIYFGSDEQGSFKLNGKKIKAGANTYTADLAAGSYEITKADKCNIFGLKLTKK